MAVRMRQTLPMWLFTLAMLFSVGAYADNWPQWRGAEHNGISHDKNLPATWSDKENVVWKIPLPGPAGATPVVWKDHIFLTSAVEKDIVLSAYSTEGKEQWTRKIGSGNQIARGDEGNYASPSPCTDGKHVWTFSGTGDLACHDFDGQEIWHRDIQKDYGKFEIQFGMSSTPLLDGDRLFLQLIHGEGDPKTREAIIVCVDKKTGKQLWKQDRPSEAFAENEHSYASPTLYRDGKQAFLLSHGADYIVAHSLEDGHELWRCAGLNPKEKYNPTLRLVASPVAVPGLIIAPSAKNGPVLALLPTGQGNITESQSTRLWTRPDNTPDVPSPLVVDGIVYLCRENGVLMALDRETGKEIYPQQRCFSDRYRASPVYADGKIYLTSRKGVVTVVKAGKEFEILGENKFEEDISASPAISNGRIYFRTFEHLWAIGLKQ